MLEVRQPSLGLGPQELRDHYLVVGAKKRRDVEDRAGTRVREHVRDVSHPEPWPGSHDDDAEPCGSEEKRDPERPVRKPDDDPVAAAKAEVGELPCGAAGALMYLADRELLVVLDVEDAIGVVRRSALEDPVDSLRGAVLVRKSG